MEGNALSMKVEGNKSVGLGMGCTSFVAPSNSLTLEGTGSVNYKLGLESERLMDPNGVDQAFQNATFGEDAAVLGKAESDSMVEGSGPYLTSLQKKRGLK